MVDKLEGYALTELSQLLTSCETMAGMLGVQNLSLVSLEALVNNIALAHQSDGLNIQADRAVAENFKTIESLVTSRKDLEEFVAGLKSFSEECAKLLGPLKTALG